MALANASFSKALNIAPDDIRTNKIIGVINFNQEKYEELHFILLMLLFLALKMLTMRT